MPRDLPCFEDWNAFSLFGALDRMNQSGGGVVTYAHCETIFLLASRPAVRRCFQKVSHVYIDGVGAQVGLFLLDGRWRRRFTAEDFIEALCVRWASRGDNIAFIGGESGRAERAADDVNKRVGVPISITKNGFEDVEDLTHLSTCLNMASIRLIVLGLGQPRQEMVALSLASQCRGVTVLCVGALFEQMRENPPIARWLRPLGLEWTVRLCRTPRSLAARYLLHPWFTLSWIARVRLGFTEVGA